MNKRTVGIGVLALVLAGGATAFAIAQSRAAATPAAAVNTGREVDDDGGDDEVVITLADLPAAVRTALAGITDDSTVTQVARETEDGSTTYDVEYTKDGAQWAVEFSADGTVLENEQDDDDND